MILDDAAPRVTSPIPTGKPVEEIDLTGRVFAWAEEQPVLLRMPASQLFYLACFESEEALREFYTKVSVPFVSIKVVDDGVEFLSSFKEEPIAVIVNPYFTETGRVRFLQVQAP